MNVTAVFAPKKVYGCSGYQGFNCDLKIQRAAATRARLDGAGVRRLHGVPSTVRCSTPSQPNRPDEKCGLRRVLSARHDIILAVSDRLTSRGTRRPSVIVRMTIVWQMLPQTDVGPHQACKKDTLFCRTTGSCLRNAVPPQKSARDIGIAARWAGLSPVQSWISVCTRGYHEKGTLCLSVFYSPVVSVRGQRSSSAGALR